MFDKSKLGIFVSPEVVWKMKVVSRAQTYTYNIHRQTVGEMLSSGYYVANRSVLFNLTSYGARDQRDHDGKRRSHFRRFGAICINRYMYYIYYYT